MAPWEQAFHTSVVQSGRCGTLTSIPSYDVVHLSDRITNYPHNFEVEPTTNKDNDFWRCVETQFTYNKFTNDESTCSIIKLVCFDPNNVTFCHYRIKTPSRTPPEDLNPN